MIGHGPRIDHDVIRNEDTFCTCHPLNIYRMDLEHLVPKHISDVHILLDDHRSKVDRKIKGMTYIQLCNNTSLVIFTK